MAEHVLKSAVILVADVTASVALYEQVGDAAAFTRIAAMLDRLRAIAERTGGQFVQSRGDDILCAFGDADSAASAAAAMLDLAETRTVTLHIAIHAGEAILARESIFGDAVNVAYRLVSIANANEALASAATVAGMSPVWGGKYRALQAFRFKGKALPIEVLAYHEEGALPMTTLPGRLMQALVAEPIKLELRYGGRLWTVHEAESLDIGRAEGVDVQIARAWVSRRHATLHVRDGLAMLTDRSSFGSFLSQDEAIEMRVRRTSVTLAGSGVVALGTSRDTPQAECMSFVVIRDSDGGPAPG